MDTKKRKDISNDSDMVEKNPAAAVRPLKKPKHTSEQVHAPALIATGGDFLSLRKEIGRGSFSKCYLACSEINQRLFAIKTQRTMGLSASSKMRVERELIIHRAVGSHPAIVSYIHSFKDSTNLYMQLEFCRCGDLYSYVKLNGNLKPSMARKMMAKISSGVAYLHSIRILHRDIKMANVFLNERLEPKIGDFGLAYRLPKNESRKLSRSGTPAYMSPELSCAPYICSYASDSWALGILWFGLVFEKLPFDAATSQEVAKLVCRGHFSFPQSPDTSGEFQVLIKRLLNPNPNKRPTANQLSIDLGSQYLSSNLYLGDGPYPRGLQPISENVVRPKSTPKPISRGGGPRSPQPPVCKSSGQSSANAIKKPINSPTMLAKKPVYVSKYYI